MASILNRFKIVVMGHSDKMLTEGSVKDSGIPWADPEGGDRGSGPPLEFWQKCAYPIREMVLV